MTETELPSIPRHKTIFNRISLYLQFPLVRWVLTILWTLLAAKLMLSPSGDGTIVSWISKLFGGTQETDAVGHVIISAILAFLWYWTLLLYFPPQKAYLIALAIGLIWGLAAELTQFFVPNRGSSLLDLAANTLGVFLGTLPHRLTQRRQTQA